MRVRSVVYATAHVNRDGVISHAHFVSCTVIVRVLQGAMLNSYEFLCGAFIAFTFGKHEERN